MNLRRNVGMVKRIGLGLAVSIVTLYGLNGACSPTNLLKLLLGISTTET